MPGKPSSGPDPYDDSAAALAEALLELSVAQRAEHLTDVVEQFRQLRGRETRAGNHR